MKEIFKTTEVPQESFEKKVDEIFEDMKDILKKKNKMYGGASMSLGEVGVYVHIFDKVSRLKTLITKQFNEDTNTFFEGIEDTYRDLIGYCTLGLVIQESLKSMQLSGGDLLNHHASKGTSFSILSEQETKD